MQRIKNHPGFSDQGLCCDKTFDNTFLLRQHNEETMAFITAINIRHSINVNDYKHVCTRTSLFRPATRPVHVRAAASASTVCMTTNAETAEHVKEVERYLSSIAKVEKPVYLDALIHILATSPGSVRMSPTARGKLHPFFIPIARRDTAGETFGLLRWPTPPSDDFPMPVVRCRDVDPCLTLLSSSAKSHVTRAIAEADYAGDDDRRDDIRCASSLALAYQNGDVDTSGLGIERFLTTSTGGFPDIYEGLSEFHLAKKDEASALITCERAVRAQNGWARPHAHHALLLKSLNRDLEARDAARFCLTLPLWTLNDLDMLKSMGELAGYQDQESLGKIYRRLFEDERTEEITGGKAKEQVALDRAAWLLDTCVAEQVSGVKPTAWDDMRERLAELYDEAGLNDMATFVRY